MLLGDAQLVNFVTHLPRTMRAMDLEHCPALFGRKGAVEEVEVARRSEPEYQGLVC